MNETKNERKRGNSMGFKIIYEPSGRAKEYADFALNIYSSCNFGCRYCYVPNVLHRDRKEFHNILKSRDEVLKKAEHDAAAAAGKKVLLCFTCDPYQSIDDDLQLTRKVMEIFNQYGVNWTVLTKAGEKARRDFDLYKAGDSFGCTLTFSSANDSVKWEPEAALPYSRVEALFDAHNRGIRTWVSMEPTIDPEQTLRLIEISYPWVDLFKIGKLNSENSRGSAFYDELKAIEKSIDWKNFGQQAESLLKRLGKEYYIKDDLRREMEK